MMTMTLIEKVELLVILELDKLNYHPRYVFVVVVDLLVVVVVDVVGNCLMMKIDVRSQSAASSGFKAFLSLELKYNNHKLEKAISTTRKSYFLVEVID